MDELFLEKVNEAIENNLANENFGVEELAHEIGISRSHLHRKLILLKGQTASQIIREFRLNKAMEMLQHNVATSSEISYRVGFSSPSYFNTCFRKYFGFPPGEAKRNAALKTPRKRVNQRKYLFASIAILILAALVVLNIIPRIKMAREKEVPEKSIAVLPFKYLSDEPEKQYLADGVREAILLHLSRIGDIRVIKGTSVEQYRMTDKTATEICRELGVGYLVQGSFIKHGDQIRLIVELIPSGREEAVWTDQYEREMKDIFIVESEVAQKIAAKVNAIISPEEKELIEKIPTRNLTAYDFYQRGREEYQKYLKDKDNREALEKAASLYNEALKLDPAYGQAYVGLANIYWAKQHWNEFFSENFMDSALNLANTALSYDEQLSEAYLLRGRYFREAGDSEKAAKEYDKGIRYNPNDWTLYDDKAFLYLQGEQVSYLENAYKAAELHRGPELLDIFYGISLSYVITGFFDKAKEVVEEVLKLKGDSLEYYKIQAFIERMKGNRTKANEFLLKGYRMDSSLSLDLAQNYWYLGQNKEALKYFKIAFETWEEEGVLQLWELDDFGYVYYINGYYEEAEDCFKEAMEYFQGEVNLGRYRSEQYFTYYDMARIYAFRGDRKQAIENLRIYDQKEIMLLWQVELIKNDPFFSDFRDDPEFQQIVQDIEAKYQAEHERVREWLEENDML